MLQSNEAFEFEDELPKSARESVEDYRMIQYGINVGEQYVIKLGMFGFQR